MDFKHNLLTGEIKLKQIKIAQRCKEQKLMHWGYEFSDYLV